MAEEMSGTFAVLTREVRVRVLDISATGCLVESGRRMPVGTAGRLRLQIGDASYADDVRVVRCEMVESARAGYQIAMQFLPTTPCHPRSIRHAIARGVAGLAAIAKTTLVM
jgi:PilZ domain